MLVAKHRLHPFDGDLDDYRDWLLQHAAEARAAAKGAGASPDAAQDSAQNRKEQRRQEAQERQKLVASEKAVAVADREDRKGNGCAATRKSRRSIAIVADPASYEPSVKTKLTESIRRQADVNARLEALEPEWLEVHEELEQIG